MVEKFEKKRVPTPEPILLSIDDLRDAASAKLPNGIRGSSISPYTPSAAGITQMRTDGEE